MWLEILTGVDAGRVVEIGAAAADPFVLGRVEGSDLVIRDARASRRHAELVPRADILELRDLGSANGTLVDGEPVREAPLRGGEIVQIGGVRIAVTAAEPSAAGMSTPAAGRPHAAPADERRPTWSVVGRLVEAQARRGRRIVYAAIALGGTALGLLAALVLPVGDTSDDERATAVVRAAGPATVLVQARRAGALTGQGSGWVLDERRGLVVTAAHVVNAGDTFLVAAAPARVLAAAPCEDLALLAVSGRRLPRALTLARSPAEQGETVIALGHPADAGAADPPASTRGVVSAARARLRDPAPDVPAYQGAIRTDTALDPGFSGGPLLDLDGSLVGVNAAARTAGDDERALQGANYAVAADRARRVLALLRRGRSLAWTGAGFGFPTVADLAARKLPPGLYVQGAAAGSPAARAGIGGAGELLTAVDGRSVGTTMSGYCAAAGRIGSGQVARLDLAGPGGRRRSLRLRFG